MSLSSRPADEPLDPAAALPPELPAEMPAAMPAARPPEPPAAGPAGSSSAADWPVDMLGDAASWEAANAPRAMSSQELAAAVERARRRFAGVRFTATAREELDGVAFTARTLDQVYALIWRQIAVLFERAPEGQEEFVDDEVSLMTRWSLSRAGSESDLAVTACALPGLVESVEDGTLSHEHVRRLVRELDRTPDLDLDQRQAITMISLYRHTGQDPTGFAKKVRETIAKIDPVASANRRQAATARRQVVSYPVGDGQSVLSLTGPTERIAAAAAIIRAKAAANTGSDDTSDDTLDQRMFDAAMELLTSIDGQPIPVDVHLDLVVPYAISQGQDFELAEIVGYGPILPATARELAEHATLVRRIAVDEAGHVINVSDPIPGPAAKPKPKTRKGRNAKRKSERAEPAGHPTDEQPQPPPAAHREVPNADPIAWESWRDGPLQDLLATTVTHEDLSSNSYQVPRKLKRFLEARDRRCTFPGCWRPAAMTDKDHAIPWPLGPTSGPNLGCLCRRHHRAKQAAFTLQRLPDGTARWTTRGGHTFDRQPEAF